ncbi:glutathione S-transferase family protein [Congregibacter sp.]|uniref:glutathione S-transferase family protein n=1 Tax=Congregibacter sp. TaxID=2744308 RepID=UPI00385FF921
MLELVTLPPAFGMRNVSPFCLKIEMLLTALDVPFTPSEEANPGKAPKGKLPYLVAEGQTIADSELIAEYLDGITDGGVYAGMTSQQKAHGVALTRLAEDHLYWMVVASRWLDDDWWPNVVSGFFHIAPKPVRPLVAGLARRQVRQTFNLQGLGRHTLKEQKEFAARDLQALEDAVPESGFLFGETPNIFDFTIAGMMAGAYDNQPATWITELAHSYKKLHAYTERVQETIGVYGRALDKTDA